jgi:hypothetical protein
MNKKEDDLSPVNDEDFILDETEIAANITTTH